MLLLAELRERVGIDGFLSHDEFQRLHHFGLVRGEILLRLEPEAVLVVGELPERALGTVDAQGGGASEAELRRAKHLSGLALYESSTRLARSPPSCAPIFAAS